MKNIKTKEIETERLKLCIPTKEEQYDLWSILKQEIVWRYYMSIPERFDNDKKLFQESLNNWDKQKPFFEKKIDNLDKNSDKYSWTIKLKDNNVVLGQMTVQPNDKYPDNPEIRNIGWYINPEYQKRGYAYEAASNILKFMFNEVEIDSIFTEANIINPASWKLMEKLGFERIGTSIGDHLDDDGNKLKCYDYKLTREMYLAKNNKA